MMNAYFMLDLPLIKPVSSRQLSLQGRQVKILLSRTIPKVPQAFTDFFFIVSSAITVHRPIFGQQSSLR